MKKPTVHITAGSRAGQELAQEHALLLTLLENLPACIFVKDTAGRYLIGNTAHLRLLGLGCEADLIDKTVFDFFPLEMARAFDAEDRAIFQTGQPVIGRVALNPDGRWYSVTKVPLRDALGQITGLIGIKEDITERETAAEKLRQSEQGLSTFFRASPAAISINTVESGRLIHVNDRYCEFFGYTGEELIGKSIIELNLWADPEARKKAVQRLLKEGAATDWEARYRRKSGEVRDVLVSLELIDLAGEAEPVLISMFVDITARKQAEARLNEDRKLLRTVIDHLPAFIFVKNAAGRYLLVNEPHRKNISSGRNTEMLGKTSFDFFPAPIARAFELDDQSVIKTGQPVIDREEPYEAGEKHGWYLTTKVPLRDEQGNVTGLVGIALDITESKLNKEALRASEEKFRSIVDNALSGFFQTTPEGRHLMVNPALARIYGYASPQEMLTHVTDIKHQVYVEPGRREEFKRQMEEQGQVSGFESQVKRKDGSLMWISESARVVRDAQGRVLHYEGTLEDITERRLASEVLKNRAADLERFHRLSVGRELQMIELKREVNTLSMLAGRTPPYQLPAEGPASAPQARQPAPSAPSNQTHQARAS